ncbi:hypothetical protein D4764_04G0001790 [Takifugu flavidus]|uniref:Uncharacterized protein n=1 Tax=Takifugu flavidus TaxID=433684 RepID=A0A5C6N220_9TELE|nr:hypothetical protein D4764_04G0001790 [Takifugu flavidus]
MASMVVTVPVESGPFALEMDVTPSSTTSAVSNLSLALGPAEVGWGHNQLLVPRAELDLKTSSPLFPAQGEIGRCGACRGALLPAEVPSCLQRCPSACSGALVPAEVPSCLQRCPRACSGALVLAEVPSCLQWSPCISSPQHTTLDVPACINRPRPQRQAGDVQSGPTVNVFAVPPPLPSRRVIYGTCRAVRGRPGQV